MLIVKNLRKKIKSRLIVKDVSFKVKRGQAVGFLGPNGAGKTTSFYMVVGLLKTDAGSIQLDGKEITSLPIHQRAKLGLGYLPQETSIFRGLNVQENIRAVLELRNLSKKETNFELERLMELFSLTKLRNTPAMALSGGERRRCEIARTLANNPSYILLDEPFAGIDPVAIADIRKIILLLKSLNFGLMITDHNAREILEICDHTYVISEGLVLAQGDKVELMNNKEVRANYLGENFRL